MAIVLVGLNHKTAPVEVRERLAFTEEACAEGLQKLVDSERIQEGLILSTCNRVEILATTTKDLSALQIAAHISEFLSSTRDVPRAALNKHLYIHTDSDAVRHLFRVASSLDSMVVGEPQILGQVKQAYGLAEREGTTGRILNRLLHTTFRVAKRVRTETGIAASAVSISYVAVELGRKIFGTLDDSTVLLVGAGEMAELAARHLRNAGAQRILIANRTSKKSDALAAQIGGERVNYEDLANHLSSADICICSTASDDFVITPEIAAEAMNARRSRPAFYIDISVPRNIDPAVGEIANLFVFDVDDLEAVVASNIREREQEAQAAEKIVDSEVLEFEQSLRHLDFGPTVGALREKFTEIARNEYERQRSRLGELTPEQEAAVQALLMSTVNKISHPVIHRMRRSYDTGEAENVRVWREIFGLEK
jgi:glutamyl-tRNA reductase